MPEGTRGAQVARREVVIVSAVRTPIGRLGGALAEVRPDDLAAVAVRESVARAGVEIGRASCRERV